MARPDMTQQQAEAAIQGVIANFDFEEFEDALDKRDAKRFFELHKRRYTDPSWCNEPQSRFEK